jgi:hypothetical protein
MVETKKVYHDLSIAESGIRALLCAHLLCHPAGGLIDFSKPIVKIELDGNMVNIDFQKDKKDEKEVKSEIE